MATVIAANIPAFVTDVNKVEPTVVDSMAEFMSL